MRVPRPHALLALWALYACSAGAGSSREAARPESPPRAYAASGPASAGPIEAQPSEHADLVRRYQGARALSTQHGEASYYSDSLAGNSTASGEPYDPRGFTAAHRKLPFGTVLRVTRRDTGRSVYVRVNDRGPFGKHRRIVDLSRSAAEELGLIRAGITDVKIEVVERPDARASR